MRRIYKIIGGMLIVGTLVAGIGSGVAFAEYSAFEYGGEAVLSGSERFTKTLKYTAPLKEAVEDEKKEPEKEKAMLSEEKQVLNIVLDWHYTIVEDTSVPKDTVQFTVSYLTDDKNVKPQIIENDLEEGDGYIYLDCDYQYNDLRNMMRAKDPILSDLKNHKISEYQVDRVELIEISVNPEADFTIDVNGNFYGGY